MRVRGAAFSGGGFYGNAIVGMLERLAEEEDFEPWDCMTGISTGALIAGKIAEYPKDQFEEAVVAVRDLYTPRVTADIHEGWFLGKVAALWKPSLRKTRALARLINERADVTAIRQGPYRIGLGVTNLEMGRYEIVEKDYVPLRLGFEGSASLPAFFEPVVLPGHGLVVDGGAMIGCDIGTLIKWGCTEIDAFVAVPEDLGPKALPDPKAIDVALRTFELMVHTLTWRQIKMTQLYNAWACDSESSCRKRYVKLRVFAPSVLVGDAMEFDPKLAVELQGIGREAADLVLR